MTTSWSNPNSPPDGPQVQRLRAVLFFMGGDRLAFVPREYGVPSHTFPRIIGSMSVQGGDQPNFPSRYASMSDGELLKLAARSWELSEAAWEALEDEFDRRHLDLPAPDPVPQIESLEKRNLVILRKFRDLPEALLAKGMLDSAGVPCFLADDNMVRMDWFISNLLGGVKILVDAEDFAGASEILNEPIPTDLEFQEADVYAQPRCLKCQSLDINFEEVNKPVSFGSLFFGFPRPVHRRGWLCHTCGHSWQEDFDPALNAPPSLAPPE